MIDEEEVSSPFSVIKELTDEAIDNAILHLPPEEAIEKVHYLVDNLLDQLEYVWRRG
ncbi:TPA: hypothetical protein ACQNPW_001198 [Streptococcus pyogenes]